ncbi:hypothetical protein MON38_05330 [Hymenobacter sp. DH14]|uniref:Uncharacterized protein n=1 Tax=Hymenobacter cyanobacteriorum TaxID=2926463 RepID=A0A9X2AEI4_9BACT|nr:hypothetical protein [Hymenobacter cyanobacteriorum]MCI1186832.1 hypothetical protein [Hymenobacter cyanobacteriorum]
MATIRQWATKNRNMLFLLGCVVLGQVFLYFTTTANAKREIERYRALQLAGRVAKMLSYSHGMQKVQMANGETPALALTAAGHDYIQAGDSLVKAAGSDSITAYRRLPSYTEVSVFGPGVTGNKRLIKRSE